MKNLLILILLALIAYLLYTSGIFSRAVQSVPQLQPATPNPNAAGTPRISVTVYSPYGTGKQTTPQPGGNPNPVPNNQPTSALPGPQASPFPAIDVGTFTPPPPTIIIPEAPPTLAVPNTPTPSANFTVTLGSLIDGQTVNTSPLLVSGVTAPNAVVSVNDLAGLPDAQGRFVFSVPLEPGPNVIEAVASLPDGQQTFTIITVLYQP